MLLTMLVFSLPALVNIVCLFLIVCSMFALLGIQLFGRIPYGDYFNADANFCTSTTAMLTHPHIHMHIRMHTHAHARTHTHTHTHTHTNTHTRIHTRYLLHGDAHSLPLRDGRGMEWAHA